MTNTVVFLFVVIAIYLLASSLASSYQGMTEPLKGRWWQQMEGAPFSEGFAAQRSEPSGFPEHTEVLDMPPSMAGPANLGTDAPYLLLENRAPAKDIIDVLGSQTCYDTDFSKDLEKVGSYRQMTNNYKRGTPESCSAPRQGVIHSVYAAGEMRAL
jgi:hypothetical protein